MWTMAIYEVQANEHVYYHFLVEAESEKEAREIVENYSGDFEKWIVEAEYFEIEHVELSEYDSWRCIEHGFSPIRREE
jgi:hypothetical protein